MGGKERNKLANKCTPGNTPTRGKSIVMGLVEKGGEIRAGTIDNVEHEAVEGVVSANVAPGSTVGPDAAKDYRRLSRQVGDHKVVSHTGGAPPEGG